MSSDLIAIITITISINIALFAVFYMALLGKAKQVLTNGKKIKQNRKILVKTLDQQTSSIEQLFVRICDVENLVERLANHVGNDKRNDILRCRSILSNKNSELLKYISELKLFGENEKSRLSAFRNLVSTGDIKTLDLMELWIKSVHKSDKSIIYKRYVNRLKKQINSKVNG